VDRVILASPAVRLRTEEVWGVAGGYIVDACEWELHYCFWACKVQMCSHTQEPLTFHHYIPTGVHYLQDGLLAMVHCSGFVTQVADGWGSSGVGFRGGGGGGGGRRGEGGGGDSGLPGAKGLVLGRVGLGGGGDALVQVCPFQCGMCCCCCLSNG